MWLTGLITLPFWLFLLWLCFLLMPGGVAGKTLWVITMILAALYYSHQD